MVGPSAELPRALQVLLGTVVAKRYVVDDFLGMGGMAVVFRGRHATLARKVAIKFLRPEYAHNPEVSKRFDREARAASNFDHPNCIQVFDCGETKHGLKFIVMPLLEGNELSRVLGIPLPPSQAVALGAQLLRGLEHAHSHGIVHRDLKPDNIFVTRDHERRETLKIVDFGIAKIVDQHHADGLQTKVGAIVGTPAYMSPEQAMGSDIDPRADLYSLGVILYHMLSGAAPFRAADPRGLLFQQVSMEAKPLPDSVPVLVKRLVATLMSKERNDRPPTASHALAAFERILGELSGDVRRWIPLLGAPERSSAAPLPSDPGSVPSPVPASPMPSPAPAEGGTQIYGPEDAPVVQHPSGPVPPPFAPAVRGRHPRRASVPSPAPAAGIPSVPGEPAGPPGSAAEASQLAEMNAALKKLLEGQTFVAEDNLRSGIFDVPKGGWSQLDGSDAEPDVAGSGEGGDDDDDPPDGNRAEPASED